jgi:DNA repair exonuclease SbcCD nuclease subunit
MSKILVSADIHCGGKFHCDHIGDGLTSADADAGKFFTQFVEDAAADDVEVVVLSGDITHTNHPTSITVAAVTSFFDRLNSCGKPVYVLPGNHDKGNYTHSFEFLKNMSLLTNIHVVDDEVVAVPWQNQTLYFVPYVIGDVRTNKYDVVKKNVHDILCANTGRKIIFSHFQESASVSGSEQSMVAKSVEAFDIDNAFGKEVFEAYALGAENTLLVLGHIHHYQAYRKNCGVQVIYPGNPYGMDKTDCNTPKGYVRIGADHSHEFVPCRGVKRFIKIESDDEDVLTKLRRTRLLPGSVCVLKNIRSSSVNAVTDADVREVLDISRSRLAELVNISEDVEMLVMTHNTHSLIIDEYTAQAQEQYKDVLSAEEMDKLIKQGVTDLNEAGAN